MVDSPRFAVGKQHIHPFLSKRLNSEGILLLPQAQQTCSCVTIEKKRNIRFLADRTTGSRQSYYKNYQAYFFILL